MSFSDAHFQRTGGNNRPGSGRGALHAVDLRLQAHLDAGLHRQAARRRKTEQNQREQAQRQLEKGFNLYFSKSGGGKMTARGKEPFKQLPLLARKIKEQFSKDEEARVEGGEVALEIDGQPLWSLVSLSNGPSPRGDAESNGQAAASFTIGEAVEVKDADMLDWRRGIVSALQPLKVLLDGWDDAFEWDAIRKVDTKPPPMPLSARPPKPASDRRHRPPHSAVQEEAEAGDGRLALESVGDVGALLRQSLRDSGRRSRGSSPYATVSESSARRSQSHRSSSGDATPRNAWGTLLMSIPAGVGRSTASSSSHSSFPESQFLAEDDACRLQWRAETVRLVGDRGERYTLRPDSARRRNTTFDTLGRNLLQPGQGSARCSLSSDASSPHTSARPAQAMAAGSEEASPSDVVLASHGGQSCQLVSTSSHRQQDETANIAVESSLEITSPPRNEEESHAASSLRISDTTAGFSGGLTALLGLTPRTPADPVLERCSEESTQKVHAVDSRLCASPEAQPEDTLAVLGGAVAHTAGLQSIPLPEVTMVMAEPAEVPHPRPDSVSPAPPERTGLPEALHAVAGSGRSSSCSSWESLEEVLQAVNRRRGSNSDFHSTAEVLNAALKECVQGGSDNPELSQAENLAARI
eukprot:CAMPEP_0178380084 /NCGR_PEP_ID=MMETSP0689_2-20121128/5277_1 /TAXON_ID=160604 /ORGANISM="Amphidinium massartii, Strain CS-259" /LENGTH=638 /DNA_ID=CAMNT_0020000209 /DNA_START=23 /DNA_END=1936 /DNA_ORIENTATION=+